MTPKPIWRHFQMMEIAQAMKWAKAGTVAVHETGCSYQHWEHTCHLFAQDERALRSAAISVGCDPRWIQYPGTRRVHYDLFGGPLRRALEKCNGLR